MWVTVMRVHGSMGMWPVWSRISPFRKVRFRLPTVSSQAQFYGRVGWLLSLHGRPIVWNDVSVSAG